MQETQGNSNNDDMWTKAMFGFLVFFGISALILGVVKVNGMIQISGGDTPESASSQVDFSSGVGGSEKSLEELQLMDSDGDQLSDFDELYVYKTSPYLADSDSDGYSDSEEIAGGYDPNCPKGQDCRGTLSGDENIVSPVEPLSVEPDTNNSAEITDAQKEELKKLTPDQIRKILLASGQISEEELSQINDETLMNTFLETLQQ